jgi:hypothetical protein
MGAGSFSGESGSTKGVVGGSSPPLSPPQLSSVQPDYGRADQGLKAMYKWAT